jgi:hypothetical protein
MQERRVEVVRRELLDRVKARVAARIQSVCSHLPDHEFHALVTRIAEIEIKYSTRRRDDLFDVARQSAPSLTPSVTSLPDGAPSSDAAPTAPDAPQAQESEQSPPQ